MASGGARYDAAADWYVGFERRWAVEAQPLLPADLAGRRVLEVGCGLGELSRLMARGGASVTAIDLSPRMVRHAASYDDEGAVRVCYLVGDATGSQWWDGNPFDIVVCNMALMDIDDLDGAMRTCGRVLKPGGWFSFSLLHPCFPGLTSNASVQLSSWPPDGGYHSEGWWSTDGDGVRGRVGANHRTLSTYLNGAVRAGFSLEEFREPASEVPRFLVVRCRLV